MDRVRDVLLDGADIDEMDETGFTAMHYAAGRGDSAIIRRLLLSGANVSSVIGDGSSGEGHQGSLSYPADIPHPVELCCRKSDMEGVNLLLCAGALEGLAPEGRENLIKGVRGTLAAVSEALDAEKTEHGSLSLSLSLSLIGGRR